LAYAVIRYGRHLKVVSAEEFELVLRVLGFGTAALHFEVIAPTGEFEAVVAPFAGLGREGFEWQIGPVAGEEQDRSGHGGIFRAGSVSDDLGKQSSLTLPARNTSFS